MSVLTCQLPKAAVLLSASPCHSVARSECPRKVQGGEAAVEQSVEAQATLGSDRSQLEALSTDQHKYGHSAGEIQNKAGFVDGTVKSYWNSIVTSDETASIVGNIAITATFAGESESDAKIRAVKLGA